MVEKVVLKNFQGHADTTFTVGAGITTIMGPSGSGKSALRRGIEWVVTNSVNGQSTADLVSFWNRKKNGEPKDETSVTIYVDGHTVAREYSQRVRGEEKGFNGYIIDGTEFYPAIGRADPPRRVLEILNLDLFLNFSDQHDTPFLIGMSAPKIAEQLNSVCRLSDIDDVNTNITSFKRKATAGITDKTNALEKAREDLTKYMRIAELQTLNEKVDAVSDKLSTVGNALDRVVALKVSRDAFLPQIAKKSTLSDITALLSQAQAKSSHVVDVTDLQVKRSALAQSASVCGAERKAKLGKASRMVEFAMDKHTAGDSVRIVAQDLSCKREQLHVATQRLARMKPIIAKVHDKATAVSMLSNCIKDVSALSLQRVQLMGYKATMETQRAQVKSARDAMPLTCPYYETNPEMCPVRIKFGGN